MELMNRFLWETIREWFTLPDEAVMEISFVWNIENWVSRCSPCEQGVENTLEVGGMTSAGHRHGRAQHISRNEPSNSWVLILEVKIMVN